MNAAGLNDLERAPGVRRVLEAVRGRLRALAGDARTVLACSGGADSAALALAAAGMPRAGERFVVGHVRHDLRPAGVTAREQELVRGLAGACGLGFESAEVEVPGSGSVEAAAREARYGALAAIASEVGALFVATGHHAEDQAETVLMRLLRGAGPDGLAGMRASRPLGDGLTLIRPMLGVGRAGCEAVCRAAGFEWARDETNADGALLRNAVRARVMPALAGIDPDAPARIAATAEACAAAAAALDETIGALFNRGERADGSFAWDRAALRGEPAWIAGGALRRAADELVGERGRDGRGYGALRPVLDAIGDGSTEPRVFELPGVAVEVTARRVAVRPVG